MTELNPINVFLSVINGDWSFDKFEEWYQNTCSTEYRKGYKKAVIDVEDEIYIDNQQELD
jgi:hypothetical protein